MYISEYRELLTVHAQYSILGVVQYSYTRV